MRLWAEVQRADGRWAWSVEGREEVGGDLRAATVATGESVSLLEALRSVAERCDAVWSPR